MPQLNVGFFHIEEIVKSFFKYYIDLNYSYFELNFNFLKKSFYYNALTFSFFMLI